MDFDYYYDLLKNVSTEELMARQDDEQYVKEYRFVCKKLIEARESGQEEEPRFEEGKFKNAYIEEFDSDREIPKSLDECRKMDKTVKALYAFADYVERYGLIILILIIIGGIFVSLTGAIVIDGFEETDFNAVYFISNLFVYIVYAIITHFVYKTIAAFISGFASIVYSNKITSNISLYSAKK